MENEDSKNNFSHPAVIVTVLILIFVGGYFLFNKNQNQNPSQSEIAALKTEVENLKNAKAETTQKPSTNPPVAKAKSLSDIIAQWRKSTAFVECEFFTTDTNQVAISGSGLIVDINGSLTVITNKHIVNYLGYTPYNCHLKFPDDSFMPYIFNNNDITVDSTGLDIAYIKIPSDQVKVSEEKSLYSISIKDRVQKDLYSCKQSESIGNQVVILGYPSYGSSISVWGNNPVEVTATEGIISGKDGIYLTTSAKIEHGNSGGLAIDKTNNCYLGIPTASFAGEIESLGRILPASYVGR